MKKIMCFLFAVGMLISMASAIEYTQNVNTSVKYHGGENVAMIHGTESGVLETHSNITHTTSFDVSITQNGENITQLLRGLGEVDVEITVATSASITGTVSTSDSPLPNAQSIGSPKGITPYFDSGTFTLFDTEYTNCMQKYSGDTNEGVHIMNKRIALEGGGYTYYKAAHCTKTFTNPVDISIDYYPINHPSATGMGKGYLYCEGNLYLNGENLGAITSNSQTFTAKTNITGSMASLPVVAEYECYFISELYDSNGNKQVIENIVHQMPGGVPIRPTVTIPTTVPFLLNLIPWIRLNTTNYTTTTTIDVPENTPLNLTFIVVRDDSIPTITTANLTWTFSSTPTGIPGLPSNPPTYWYDPIIPPIKGGDPPYVLRPPIEITVCADDEDQDTITLSVDPPYGTFLRGDILESDDGDNIITITIYCIKNDEMRCHFNRDLVLAPGESGSSIMSCQYVNGTSYDCPDMDEDWVSTNPNFLTFFRPVVWESLSGAPFTAYEFNVTATETGQPEIAYSGRVDVQIDEADAPWRHWDNCPFNVIWRRPDCRYYM